MAVICHHTNDLKWYTVLLYHNGLTFSNFIKYKKKYINIKSKLTINIFIPIKKGVGVFFIGIKMLIVNLDLILIYTEAH